MKIAALVTSLVLGTSSLALAAPDVQFRRRPSPEERMPRQWTTLASNAELARGRATLDVSSRQRFAKLELRANGWGDVYVGKLVITFANGEKQFVNVGKSLGRNASTVIDLDGKNRQIDKIAIAGKASRRASLSILAI